MQPSYKQTEGHLLGLPVHASVPLFMTLQTEPGGHQHRAWRAVSEFPCWSARDGTRLGVGALVVLLACMVDAGQVL